MVTNIFAPGREVTPLAGVWIEIGMLLPPHESHIVTPLAGVWIEMTQARLSPRDQMSLPSRECGLKLDEPARTVAVSVVTPLAGVWIEIRHHCRICAGKIVTPLAGVWIEIINC